jgi:predicted  nucleic acid-binding Zn-ribbon protein
METLKNRYKKLYDEKIRVETELKTTTAQLAAHQETAKANFGTDSIEELEKKLETVKMANEKQRKDYQDHLNLIEAQLNAIKEDPND